MALVKQNININFAQGLDTKTDKFQVAPGKFLDLQNSIFSKAGQLTKRNGFGPLASLTNSASTFLTTFNGNLTAIGDIVQAYSEPTNKWVNRGNFKPLDLSVLPLVRSNLNQSYASSAVSDNGFVCTVYTDNPASGAVYKYVVADAITGQNLVPPTSLPSGSAATGGIKVYLLGQYFIVLFPNVTGGTTHLQYIAINSLNLSSITPPVDISTAITTSTTVNFDGAVFDTKLFIAYNSVAGGQHISLTYITTQLGAPVTPLVLATQIATLMSIAVNASTPASPKIWAVWHDLPTTTTKTVEVDGNLNILSAVTTISTGVTAVNIAAYYNSEFTPFATNGISVLLQQPDTISYDAAVPYPTILSFGLGQAGSTGGSASAGGTSNVFKSIGMYSRPFSLNGYSYFVGAYASPNQPTYFLMQIGAYDSGLGYLLPALPVMRLSYSNGGGFATTGLTNITLRENGINFAYLRKDFLEAQNSATANNQSIGITQPAIYSQTGVNLATVEFETKAPVSEIASSLNLGAGFLWEYDGYVPVEQNFLLWPEYVELTGSGAGGSLEPQQYYYQVIYEWADNQGNIHRSAPSIPVTITTTGATSSVTVKVPCLKLTYKSANPLKISIYRWSTAHQVYYQVTSISAPLINDSAITLADANSVTFVDTLIDASIVGNSILYTTGGVIENIAPSAPKLTTLFDNRLWILDAEDRNLLWFSKQVIEATPVEMSDLFTIYAAPSTSAQASTGPITAMSPMDDKLVLFKKNAIGYINGTGPDNAGSNNQYSNFTLINSVVGCVNQDSIVLTPMGLMFQSSQGIWLLGRDLSVQYIGAPVESLTEDVLVVSAVNIPMTTQVRFTMDSGKTLMYDYFYQQWGTFVNIPADSSVIYNNLHTYLNNLGQVFQETPGAYLDNSRPVLMRFTTSWLSLAGLQGYERFYEGLMLGETLSPFKLNVQLAYDYDESVTQSLRVAPSGYGDAWGTDPYWGQSSPWGGPSRVFEARMFPDKQKCESFRLTISEVFDSSIGQVAGAGLTLSGLNLVVGLKKGNRTSSASRSFG